ncbi:MAG: DUF192 domain-containing protein [Candidatus Gottesmanbacteria bacterium]
MNPKLILFIAVVIIGAFSVWFYTRHPLNGTVIINKTVFLVDLALNPIEKEKGLSYRKSLAPKHGMLFVYDHKEIYPFWMKGMNFPLDFIWLDGNIIVDITRNVQPANGLNMHVVKPNVMVDKILEINAGEVDTYNINIGDTVLFNK